MGSRFLGTVRQSDNRVSARPAGVRRRRARSTAIGRPNLGAFLSILVSRPLYRSVGVLGCSAARMGMGAVSLYLDAARLRVLGGSLGLFARTARRVVCAGLFPARIISSGRVFLLAQYRHQPRDAAAESIYLPALQPLLFWRLLRWCVPELRHFPAV